MKYIGFLFILLMGCAHTHSSEVLEFRMKNAEACAAMYTQYTDHRARCDNFDYVEDSRFGCSIYDHREGIPVEILEEFTSSEECMEHRLYVYRFSCMYVHRYEGTCESLITRVALRNRMVELDLE
jgi:hypothetical protein